MYRKTYTHYTQAPALTEALDHFAERAAIRERDGAQPRAEAEAAALIEAAEANGIPADELRDALTKRRSPDPDTNENSQSAKKEPDMSSAKKKATAKEDIDVRIIGDGNRDWAVISMLGHFRFDEECPCVIYSGLKTREAAEVAARDAKAGLDDPTHGHPYGPSEVPIKYFNAVGRVVRELRKANVDDGDVFASAVRIQEAVVYCDDWSGTRTNETEIPF